MIGKFQPLHWLAANNMGLDDFVDIALFHESVPDRLGIDHDRLTVLALLEASGLVGSYGVAYTVFSQLSLELFMK